jgi:hypothetical protein
MRRVLALTLLCGLLPASGRAGVQDLDVVVENGRVHDGTGAPWIRSFEPDEPSEENRLDAVQRERGRDPIEATLALLRPGSVPPAAGARA